jgi:two-component system KDP operon response regulator KdpE
LSLILLIDDNLDLLDVLTISLESKGHRVLKAGDGRTGLEMFQQHHPDLVVLDVMMPSMSGWEVCRCLRETSNVPIILLTVLGQEKDIVRGLREGADDYVIKPFSSRELLERIQALLRRTNMNEKRTTGQSLAADSLVLVTEDRQVIINGRRIKLTPIEFRLLSTLLKNAGRVVSHRKLLQAAWGKDEADIRQLKVYIYYLRQKLENDPRNPRYILSERGAGYRLEI